MANADDQYDVQFFGMVLSLQAAVMHQLGKQASPITGKVERDLIMAKETIGMLEMLERKTKGNLSEDEEKLMKHILYEIRMNYLDELKKESPGSDLAS